MINQIPLDNFLVSNRKDQILSIDEIKKKLENIPWKKGLYAKQSWKNWLHSIAPYVGRITPAFAHWLIKFFTKKDDIILDPFCGIGTIPLEADLMGHQAIGVDLNPYAYIISMAKFDRAPLEERIEWIKNIDLNISNVNLDSIDPYALQYYDSNTLKEIIAIRNKMVEDNQFFLYGCLLGIVHGHRPQHLSAITGYIIPYPKKDMKPIYKNVKANLIKKVQRMYKTGFKFKTNSIILKGDIKNIDLPIKPVDIIISSPPYYETIDYIASNKLRLIIMGYSLKEQKQLTVNLIQHKNTYIQEMEKVGLRLKEILKPNGLCVFILGDVNRGKKIINTADDISKLYEKIGFETLFCIEDKIPNEKATIGKFGGCEVINNKTEKSDRILAMHLK